MIGTAGETSATICSALVFIILIAVLPHWLSWGAAILGALGGGVLAYGIVMLID